MVASVVTNGTVISAKSGWTDIAYLTTSSNPKQRAMYKFADAADVASSTIDFAITSSYGEAVIEVYTGVDTTSPMDFTPVTFDTATSTTTAFTVPSATVVTANTLLIGGPSSNTGTVSTSWTAPTGWTDTWNTVTGAGGATQNGKSHLRGYGPTTQPTGATGSITWTLSSGRAGNVWMAGLRPAAAGPPPAATPTFRGFRSDNTGANSSSTSTMVMTLPTGTAPDTGPAVAGDTCYMFASLQAAAAGVTMTPVGTGWTQLPGLPSTDTAAFAHINGWYKTLTSADITTGSVSFTTSGASRRQGTIVVTSPSKVDVSAISSPSNGATATFPSVTPTASGQRLAVAGGTTTAGTPQALTVGTPLIEQSDQSTTSTLRNAWLFVATDPTTAGVAEPTETITSADSATQWRTWVANIVDSAARVTNNAEGGTALATVTAANSTGTGQTPFDAVSTPPAGAELIYDTAQVAHGTKSFGMSTGATAGSAYMEWGTNLPPSSVHYFRANVYFTANPAATLIIAQGRNATASNSRISVNTTGKVVLSTGAGTTLLTSTASVPLNQWCRIEASIQPNASSTTGAAELRLYQSLDGATTTDIQTGSAFDFLSTPTTIFRIGIPASVANVAKFWMDDLAIDAGGFVGPAGSGITPTLTNRWIGALTTTGATVSVKTASATSVRLKVSTTIDLLTSPVFTLGQVPDSDNLSRHTISGLVPDTTYYYGVEMNNSTLVQDGQFKTAPSGTASFSFAFGSCQNATDSDAWTRLAARNPLFFIHLGDMWYDDGASQTLASYLSHYDAKLNATNLSGFFKKTPVAYTWSDHDFGMANNAVGVGNSVTPTAQSAYAKVVPYWEKPDAGGGIYQTFVIGRVRFIMTDLHSYKTAVAGTDNSSKTMMGTVQKQWFKDIITNASEPLIIWGNELPWNGPAVAGDDAWDGYTTERTELANFIVASGKKVAIISGDAHSILADDGTNSPGSIPIMGSSALSNTASIKSGPYSQGYYPNPTTGSVRQYGIVNITDAGSYITMDFVGYDTTDTSRITLSKTYTTATLTNIGAVDTLSASVTDNGTFGIVQVTANDTLSASVTETKSFGTVSVTASDAAAASVSDIGSVNQSVVSNSPVGADTVSASVTETSMLQTIVSKTDTLSAATTDTSSIVQTIIFGNVVPMYDSQIKYNHTITYDGGGTLQIVGNDTVSVFVSEAASFSNVIVSRSDTLSASVTETRIIGTIPTSTTDTPFLSVSDDASLKVIFASVDSLPASVDDILEFSTTSVNTSDVPTASVTESRSFGTVVLSASDVLAASAGEAVGDTVRLSAADVASASVSSTTMQLVNGNLIIGSSDSLAAASTETTAFATIPITAIDSTTASITEQIILTVFRSASDATSASVTDTTTKLAVVRLGTDTLSVGITELNSKAVTAKLFVYAWTGSAWALALPFVWNGSAWIEPQIYYWNGSVWV